MQHVGWCIKVVRVYVGTCLILTGCTEQATSALMYQHLSARDWGSFLHAISAHEWFMHPHKCGYRHSIFCERKNRKIYKYEGLKKNVVLLYWQFGCFRRHNADVVMNSSRDGMNKKNLSRGLIEFHLILKRSKLNNLLSSSSSSVSPFRPSFGNFSVLCRKNAREVCMPWTTGVVWHSNWTGQSEGLSPSRLSASLRTFAIKPGSCICDIRRDTWNYLQLRNTFLIK